VYGVHPFCLVKAKTKDQFFGIFFRNSNAQAPVITFNDDGTSTLSYITTGGNLDINFFFKGTAKQIIADYQNFIGLPALPPLWSLGWHASAYAYRNLSMVKDNVEAYLNHSIPLEGVWLDIPYMDTYHDFSVDTAAFAGLKDFVKDIRHKHGMKVIPIVDAGLSDDGAANPYVEAAVSMKTLL
jgi:alpha-glucosidase (family GH31 glycosyl hydrolase)